MITESQSPNAALERHLRTAEAELAECFRLLALMGGYKKHLSSLKSAWRSVLTVLDDLDFSSGETV